MRRPAAAVGSAVFFVVTPGTVAGVVPGLITRWELPAVAGGTDVVRVLVGASLLAAGLAVLVGAFVRFVREGSGTPAPVAPTEELVVGGAYRYVRNPMYVAVLAVVLGQAVLFRSPGVLGYAVLLWAVVAGFVRLYEEPVLARTHGARYAQYRHHVRAWVPRLTPWRAPEDAVTPPPRP